ncbi:4Fe-4S dicluster domain-containing protein [Sanguibacter antarcticus]|uniref:4Fe-4S dicluster protein n=1 Tax=Sanguibacter antarcticus TaxID=372484 RepID=A0A2A9E8B2_9MICO|nr:4Fe-4S dicluster domain-containing protein [Sanguibacter antarcticus]PFG34400.1 4Fe-4S dicluster protein [Sanguibacter antarcticus]
MSGPADALARWVAHQPAGLDLEIVCVEHDDPSQGDPSRTVVRLPACLRDVSASAVLELLTAGAATVLVRTDGCDELETSTEHLATVAHLLAAAGVPRLQVQDVHGPGAPDATDVSGGPRAPAPRPVLDAVHLPVARRSVFGLGAASDADLAAPVAAPSGPRLLSAALAELVPPDRRDGLDAAADAVRLGAHGCTACGVCVRACPTDALSLRFFGGEDARQDVRQDVGPLVTSLLQDPVACDGCLRCVDLCPEDVLTVTGAWGWDEVLSRVDVPRSAPVASLTTKECSRCSARFPTTDASSLCPVCAYRRLNPFASRLPPGYEAPAV